MIERGGWVLPLVVGVILRLAFVRANEMDLGDWVSRTVRAAQFLKGVAPIWARTSWPEGNYLLPAVPLWLGGDPYWSVRVSYALVGSLAIPLIYVIGQRFEVRRGGLLAAWVLAFLPFHVYVTANGAMSEGPFLVFVLGAMASAMRWAERPMRTGWLIVCALCIVGAEAFRFDGVFIGASLGLVALFVKDERGRVVGRPRVLAAIAAFGLIMLAYPVALLISWKVLWGDSLYFWRLAAENAGQSFGSGGIHPRWSPPVYLAYSIGFWPFLGPCFVLTPLVWAASWFGLWKSRRRVASAILMAPLIALTLVYVRAAMAHALLNQVRYVTVLSVPLLACLGVSVAHLQGHAKRAAIGIVVASMAVFQAIPIDAAWHERGVVTRQLAPFALVRRGQYLARDAVRWLNLRASADQKLLVTPHAFSPWLVLARNGSVPHLVALTVYRTANLVHDSASLTEAITDSLRTADWVIASGGGNVEGVRGGLVKELVQPKRSGSDTTLLWNGVRMRLASEFGVLRLYRVLRTSSTSAGQR